MDESKIDLLLQDLKHSDEAVRERASQELWRIWFQQKGAYGLELIERSQMMFDTGDVVQAEAVLTNLIIDHPDFAEAWNRRALLYYMIGEFQKSLDDCYRVVELNPIHFGAWHGMGLCHAALGQYREAISAFRQALELQPYSLINQQLLLECTARLS